MRDASGLYRRLDDWARALSRGQYALVAGLVAGVCVFVVGLFSDASAFSAVAMAVTMTVVYYAMDPNDAD